MCAVFFFFNLVVRSFLVDRIRERIGCLPFSCLSHSLFHLEGDIFCLTTSSLGPRKFLFLGTGPRRREKRKRGRSERVKISESKRLTGERTEHKSPSDHSVKRSIQF